MEKKSAFRSIHQTIYWLIFVFVCVLVYPVSAVAQQDTDLPTYKMEEIIVIGESLLSLKRQAIEAEDIKFKLFNDLNSRDEFDIICEYVARTEYNSRIKRRYCDARYMWKAEADATFDYLTLGIPPPSDYQLAVLNARKTEALNKEMVELGMKHPSLAKAMINEIELKQRYILERRERYKDSILVGHPEPEEYFGDELKFLDLAYSAYIDGMMGEEIWNYWDRRLISVILQEPYRSIWRSSRSETYEDIFIAYINGILRE